MDQLIPFVQGLIDKFGLVAVLAAFGAVNYLLIARSSRKAEDAASAAESAREDANTRQQDAVTAQFTVFSNENRRLQARVDTLEAAQVAMAAASAVQEKELRATQHTAELTQAAHQQAVEKASALECEVQELRGKVTALEAERTTRANDLARETDRAAKLEREVHELRMRVAKQEGEIAALDKIIKAFRLVSVLPPPDDDPPPGGAPVAMHTTTTKQTVQTSVKTEDAA
jgi:chromosome segregation ATPase